MNNIYNIHALCFYSSESCNLNCSYCQIAKMADHHSEEAKKVKLALGSGEYLNNYKKALTRLNANFNEIYSIELWGQEPTLTLKEFTSQIPEIFRTFPNWNSLFFSTNGVGFADDIVECIKTINEYSNQTFHFNFQFSCDGTFATKKYRGLDTNLIINNAKKVLNQLNSYSLKDTLHVGIALHNVIARNLLDDLDTDEKIIQYWQDLDNLATELYQYSTNPQVKMADHFSPGVENPIDTSAFDGRKWFEFYNRSKKLCHPSLFKGCGYNAYEGIIIQQVEYFSRKLNTAFNTCNINKAINMITDPFKSKEQIKQYNLESFCKANYNYQLKMRYDGTLLYCQNAIYALNEESFTEKDLASEARRNYAKRTGFINILSCSDKALEKHMYEQEILNELSLPFLFMETLNLMLYLLKTHQIDESYQTDPEKFYRHSFLLGMMGTCLDNNLTETGSVFGRSLNLCRLYANGLMDIIEMQMQSQNQE